MVDSSKLTVLTGMTVGGRIELDKPDLHEMFTNMLVSRMVDRYHSEMTEVTGESVHVLTSEEKVLFDVMADESVMAMTGTLLQTWERLAQLHTKVKAHGGTGPLVCSHCYGLSKTFATSEWPCVTASLISKAFDDLDRIHFLN